MYYLLLVILYPISLLPFWALYGISNFTYFLLFKVFKYRRAIVLDNLNQAFPEKSEAEIREIMEKFYLSFCDQWVETLKLLSIPLDKLNRRLTCDWDNFNDFCSDKLSVYTFFGHQFNWEWCTVVGSDQLDSIFGGIYLPLNSKAFDRLIYNIRSRTGAVLLPANNLKSALEKIKDQNHVIGVIGDQTPANLKNARWYSFMNRPTPFFKSPELAAQKRNAGVVFGSLRKVKRGYYHLEFIHICDDAAKVPEGFITKRYVSLLEKELHEQPANWMWTHRRWKRQMPEGEVLN